MSPVSRRSLLLVGGSAYAASIRKAQRENTPHDSEEVPPRFSSPAPDQSIEDMAQQLAEDPEFIALVRAERLHGRRTW